MKNFFAKGILYIAGIIALTIVVAFTIYWLAKVIAIIIIILVIGLLTGPPIWWALKRKYSTAFNEAKRC